MQPITMPPKQAKTMVAAVAIKETRTQADPGSFQLPPYWEDRPVLWLNQAKKLMRGHNITYSYITSPFWSIEC